jgi:hypothetical protein
LELEPDEELDLEPEDLPELLTPEDEEPEEFLLFRIVEFLCPRSVAGFT